MMSTWSPLSLQRGAVPWRLLGLAAFAAGGLALVMAVHAAGQTLLATLLLAVLALGLWAYGSPRVRALPYLYPAIAAALVFVVFPMAYTLWMSFTNHSSRNLQSQERTRDQLLEQVVVDARSQRAFQLRAQGELWVLVVAAGDGQAPLVSAPLGLGSAAKGPVPRSPAGAQAPSGAVADAPTLLALMPVLRTVAFAPPQGPALQVISLREVAAVEPQFQATADGALKDRLSGTVYRPLPDGFFTSAQGERLQPGYRVAVGLQHYARIFTEPTFREPFMGVFVWTVLFSGLTVLGAGALGLVLAVLLNWEPLKGKGVYRLVLFLPYAVPAFLSILVFKGLFNQNMGAINLILNGLFGVSPAWFSDPVWARTMLLMVNIWLGFPYMMVLCSGLISAIPVDLYEASALSGASPWDNFRRITLPLILKPLTPLLISAFAFNFNNFVLISLLTGGRPDHLNSDVPAGTTDILVSYTWRIAFQDSGNQYGLAAAISTLIFVLVAAITLVQLRLTRVADTAAR